MLRIRLDGHRKWAAKVSKGLIAASNIEVETNSAKCGFGKWLASDEVAILIEKNPNSKS